MKTWHLFFICWVAWAWKWTLINWLLEENIENLEFALSCKTREPREHEIIWKDYIKLSVEEFKKAIDDGEFLEYNFVHNQNYYWTRKADVIDNGINQGKIILKEIDMLIVPEVLETLKGLREKFSIIFLDLPIETIKERMIDRWDDVTWEDYKNRILSAEKERKNIPFVDFVIDARKTKWEVLSEVKEIILSKI